MAQLVVGGLPIPLAVKSPPKRDILQIGDFTRAFDGSDRGITIAEKNNWSFETPPVSRAAAETYRAALHAAPPVACSGDVLGGSQNCRGKVTSYQEVAAYGAPMVVLGFTLYQA